MSQVQGKQWFVDRMDEQGLSLSEMARRIGIHKSALSRALDGKRQVKSLEVGKIATNLGTTREQVIDHLESIASGAAAGKQDLRGSIGQTDAVRDDPAGGARHGEAGSSETRAGKRRPLYPGFGFMKGLIKIEPGFDVTGPFSDESWEDGYLGDDRLNDGNVGKSTK